jgi:hypothetical protein
MKEFPESRMYPAVKRWLQDQGYRVFPEAWGHDVVALKDEKIVVVELKTSFTNGLCRQLMRAVFANQIYAGVPSRPRRSSIDRCRILDVGLLIVCDSVNVEITAPENPHRWESAHARSLEALKNWTPDDYRIGGLPNLAGDGDAQRVSRLVAEYRQRVPNASWRELFANVRNHYANHNSMRQGQKACAERAQKL